MKIPARLPLLLMLLLSGLALVAHASGSSHGKNEDSLLSRVFGSKEDVEKMKAAKIRAEKRGHYKMAAPAPKAQTEAQALQKSEGCIGCHVASDRHTMHENPAVILGCVDCHGGNASITRPPNSDYKKHGSAAYREAMNAAHILPANEVFWNYPSSANPKASYTKLHQESPSFIRFINPGDLRVARESCGACHLEIIQASERSLMSTSAMLWGGAAYNNGILPYKHYILGEAYTADSLPATLVGPVKPTPAMTAKGILPQLAPLPAWETAPPADVFRVFESGGRVINSAFPEIGLPNSTGLLQRLDEPGRPDIKQSNRGPGTGSRIAVPLINVTKTRLNDPHLWFLGTNEQPGDYRSSGCTGCHTIYANDRDPLHSSVYASAGNNGETQTVDPTIPRQESGHPIAHSFTRAIPSSQCMTCHMHQPNIFVNSFYGYTMWDYESDAPHMWPEKQKYPTDKEAREILDRNPEEAAIRGKWSDPGFLRDVSLLNPELNDTQFADYHGHGWNFRAVYKRDRHGALLDKNNNIIPDDDAHKFQKAVHMASIHMEKGMQCVDCHFGQDAHGNGHIYGEVAAAIEIDCVDCHGTTSRYPTLRTSGPAARPGGNDLSQQRVQDGRQRFVWRDGKLFQRAATDPKKEWEVSLVKDAVNPANPHYNEKAARAKLMSAGEAGRQGQWGPEVKDLAHSNEKMMCFTCHTSWTTSCSGCHLPIQANWKTERHHYEGGETRNYATYNPQVVRDDVFMLGIHSSVKGGRIAPVRSSSALILSSTNANRERIYIQQAPIAASGFSSQAFAPHFAHTERKEETKTCSDCHVSAKNDNNAIMAQLLLQGTGFVNFVGFNAWLGEQKHVEAVQVTEWDEPQAVIGSYLHKYAYPDWYAAHQDRKSELVNTQSHGSDGEVGCLQLRGEYLFAAEAGTGMRVYDVANIANKGVAQRIVTAPYSPLGQKNFIRSKDASCVALPTNQPIAPLRNQGDLMRITNLEQPFHPIYSYAAITDTQEGLILTDVNTLADGNARNNTLKRAVTWNPDGILNGARHITLGGRYAYIAATVGLVIVDLDKPTKPRLVTTVAIDDARASALQFRYLFVTSRQGMQVIDVTHAEKPELLPAVIPLQDAQRVYVARTYAYVAAGKQGLAIIDVEKADAPKVYQLFDDGGKLDDARDVIVGSTNASLFAYVADGKNGLKVVQLTAPDTQPRFYGFSPEPKPHVIAWRKTVSPARSLSRGLDRDRAVDETGGQIAVFGRLGSRPFNVNEMNKLYQREDGSIWTVLDDVKAPGYTGKSTMPASTKPTALNKGQP